jgi:hypothetical protein
MFTDALVQRRLVKAAEQHFVAQGWRVEHKPSEKQDLFVTSDQANLRFSVKCINQSVRNFRSTTEVIEEVERNARYFRSVYNRPVVNVLDRNFLFVNLDSLLSRGLFVIEVATLPTVANLAHYGEYPPPHPCPYQTYLLERSIDYATSVAERYQAKGDRDSALRWARAAFDNSNGFTVALITLFRVYRDTGHASEAAEIADLMVDLRPNDPHVLKIMRDFAMRQNDSAGYERWNDRLKELASSPRTFDELVRLGNSKYSASIAAEPFKQSSASLGTKKMRWWRHWLQRGGSDQKHDGRSH